MLCRLSSVLLVCLFLLGTLSWVSGAQGQKDKLVFLQAVWRHGDRSPVGTYRLDPYQADSWPQGMGQLTTRGMTQHVVLGGRLRKHYIEEMQYLNASYHRDEIYVQSTDMDRTLLSAISNLIGFYATSPRVDIDYPKGAGWPGNYQPIPVHTVNLTTDHIAYPERVCPRQLALIGAMSKTPEYKALMKNRSAVFKSLSNLTGEMLVAPLSNYGFPFWQIQDALYVEQLYGKKKPDWLTAEMQQEIDYLHGFYNDWIGGYGLSPVNGLNFSLEMPKQRGGPLLWAFIHNMHDKVDCINETAKVTHPSDISKRCQTLNKLKYHVYSAHDTTVNALFATFHFNMSDFDDDGWPAYTACLTLELWSNASASSANAGYDAYYVKAVYWKLNTTEPREVTRSIIGCEHGCTLQQFADRSEIYKPMPSIEEHCANVELFKDTTLPMSSSTQSSPDTSTLPM